MQHIDLAVYHATRLELELGFTISDIGLELQPTDAEFRQVAVDTVRLGPQ